MITAMCKAQGVKVVDKDYVAGDPGPINAASMSKSARQSQTSAARTPRPPRATDPSSSRQPTISSELALPLPKTFNEKVEAWFKKIFCQNVELIRDVRVLKRENRKGKKVIARLEHQLDYQSKILESTSGTKYIPPEAMSSEEEEIVDDLYDEPAFEDEEPPLFGDED